MFLLFHTGRSHGISPRLCCCPPVVILCIGIAPLGGFKFVESDGWSLNGSKPIVDLHS